MWELMFFISTEPAYVIRKKKIKVRQCNDVDKEEFNYTPTECKSTANIENDLLIFRKVEDAPTLISDKFTTIHTFRENL